MTLPDLRREAGRHRLASHALAIGLVVVLVPIAATAVPFVFGADGTVVAGEAAHEMQPRIDSDHLVFLEHPPAAAIERGDVILYERGGDTSFTRVSLVTSANGETAFITSTDARIQPSGDPVLASQIRGRMTHSMPYLGAIVAPLRGAPVLGADLAMGIAVYELLAVLGLVAVVVLETDALVTGIETNLTVPSGDGLALTREDLTMTTLSLAALAAFATGVLLSAPSPVTVTFGILSLGLFGYAGFLWWTAPPSRTTTTVPVITGSLPPSTTDRPELRLDSPTALAAAAATADRPVTFDREADQCFFVDEEAVYVCEPPATPFETRR